MSKHKMHFLLFPVVDGRPAIRTACSPLEKIGPEVYVVTYDKSLVTCGLCKRTRYFKGAQAPKEGPTTELTS